MDKNKTSDCANYFDHRAKNYENVTRWVVDPIISNYVLECFKGKELGDILDAGCGTGYLGMLIAKYCSYNSITFVDSSYKMISAIKNTPITCSIENESIESFCSHSNRKYDTVLLRQVLHYVDEPELIVRLLFNHMNCGGFMYVGQIIVNKNDKCKEWLLQLNRFISPSRKRVFNDEDLKELFSKNGFTIVCHNKQIYHDSLKDFYLRKSTSIKYTYNEIYNMLLQDITDEIRNEMHINITLDDIHFEVSFDHFLLRK